MPTVLVSRHAGTGDLICVLPSELEEPAIPGGSDAAPSRTARLAAMVQWFSPAVLLRTAIGSGVSSLFGRHADPRALEAFGDPQPICFDYSEPERGSSPDGGFWIDYVADSGDGWNPTYAIACAVARDFRVTTPRSDEGGGESQQTYRGRLLILGGDLVYPVPSGKAYEERFMRPYRTAYRAARAREAASGNGKRGRAEPHVFAIPGNHDWYDSLVAFKSRFCTGERCWPGGWRTRQTRSYFALKLPRGWWLLGTDVQLGSDIDAAQRNYFEQMARFIPKDDRIILCTPEPHWTNEATAPAADGVAHNNLHYLEEILGKRVRVFLAGDKHHYRRHTFTEADGKISRHKITAGGGGAFLHPTHNGARTIQVLENQDGTETYRCEKTYPAPLVTRLLGLNLLWAFPIKNPKFGIVTAVLYLVTCATVQAPVGHLGWGKLGRVLVAEKQGFINSPTACLWTVLLCLAAVTFIRSDRWWYRWGAGAVHGMVHIVAAGLVGWVAARLVHPISGFDASWLLQALIIFVGGWAVGSLVVGTYLGLSISVFGRHANDAFAALAIQDYKNFLRLQIRPDGTLRIHPIKLHRVPRDRRWWRRRAAAPLVGRRPPRAGDSKPDLIEKWIDVR